MMGDNDSDLVQVQPDGRRCGTAGFPAPPLFSFPPGGAKKEAVLHDDLVEAAPPPTSSSADRRTTSRTKLSTGTSRLTLVPSTNTSLYASHSVSTATIAARPPSLASSASVPHLPLSRGGSWKAPRVGSDASAADT